MIFLKQYRIKSASLNSPGNVFLLFFYNYCLINCVYLKKKPNQQILTNKYINMSFLISSTVHFEFGTLSWLQVSQKLQYGVQQHPTRVNQEFSTTCYGSNICNRKIKQSVKNHCYFRVWKSLPKTEYFLLFFS